MRLLFLYILFCTGIIGFVAGMFGQENTYLQYGHYVLLAASSLWCFYLFLRRKIVITTLTMVLAGYIIVRIIVVSSFALFHDYSFWGYVYPLKNWILLLNFFVIGQSTAASDEAINKLITKALFITVLLLVGFELLGAVAPTFGKLPKAPSRVPALKYRFSIDEFIIVYVYFVLSVKMIRNELSLMKFQAGILMLLLAVAITQTKQLLPAILIVSLFLTAKRFGLYLTKRKALYTLSLAALAAALAAGMYLLLTAARTDTAFSFWRRSLELEYVREKVIAYSVFGYPIPSNLFGSAMPKDIIRNFYGFDFDVTLFPSDLPFPFILAEEGILGLLFVVVFIALGYRKSPEKVTAVLIVLLSLIGTFRMYYMIPIQSSFTYFLLGFFTRPAAQEAHA